MRVRAIWGLLGYMPSTNELDYADRSDFDDADRGFLAALSPAVIRTEDGRVIWDGEAYAFLDEDCPPSAHPSLWRQAGCAPSRACTR